METQKQIKIGRTGDNHLSEAILDFYYYFDQYIITLRSVMINLLSEGENLQELKCVVQQPLMN